MFSYIFKGAAHTDTSVEHMQSIGMSDEQIGSVLNKKAFEPKKNLELRRLAYKSESDPLYIEWQFELEQSSDDADKYKQVWIDKVIEIKSRCPIN